MMRIITGRARGARLAAPAGEETRPTSERAKEAIFSMLHLDVQDAQVLDLFAGSGQLALEAVSRGAAHAVLCDKSRDAERVIRSNLVKTRLESQCELFCMDYTALLRAMRGRAFDLVFLDPPYAERLIPDALRRMLAQGQLAPAARIVCETADAADVFGGDATLAEHFTLLRATRYGVAQVTLLEHRGREEQDGNRTDPGEL